MKKIGVCLVLLVYQYIAVGQSVTLRVVNGYGSGQYNVGDTVYVYAKAFTTDSIMDKWVANAPLYIEQDHEWLTRLVMPDHDVVIRADWKYSKPMTVKETIIDVGPLSKKIWYAIPPKIKGIVTLHHFTNGVGLLFFNRVEYRYLCQYLYDKGLMLVSYNAYEVDDDTDGLKQWRVFPIDAATNEDHLATATILDSLEQRGLINQKTPRFAIGMSAGGAYTPSVAFVLRYKAWVNFCTKGNGELYEALDVPGIQIPSQHDFNSGKDSDEQEAYINYQKLVSRGIEACYQLHARYPLHKERFARVNGINVAQSQQLHAELKSAGMVDADDLAIVQSDTIEYFIKNRPDLLPSWADLNEEKRKECLYQYRCAFADHELSADHTYKIYDFFVKAYMASASEDPLPVASKLEKQKAIIVADGSLSLPALDKPTSYRLINLMGSLCGQGIVQSSIDVSHMAAGWHYVQYWNNGQWHTQAFLIVP